MIFTTAACRPLQQLQTGGRAVCDGELLLLRPSECAWTFEDTETAPSWTQRRRRRQQWRSGDQQVCDERRIPVGVGVTVGGSVGVGVGVAAVAAALGADAGGGVAAAPTVVPGFTPPGAGVGASGPCASHEANSAAPVASCSLTLDSGQTPVTCRDIGRHTHRWSRNRTEHSRCCDGAGARRPVSSHRARCRRRRPSGLHQISRLEQQRRVVHTAWAAQRLSVIVQQRS